VYNPNHPLSAIATACNLAEEGVFLSEELPFYVRDICYTLTGYCVVGEHMGSVTAGTYEELHIKMIELWEILNEET